tara:strand:+ start:243 stop:422 length:180 start_codon:yes stop_codon:yes gene_type:complete
MREQSKLSQVLGRPAADCDAHVAKGRLTMYEQALRSELQAIAKEAQTAGSLINKLLTKQ